MVKIPSALMLFAGLISVSIGSLAAAQAPDFDPMAPTPREIFANFITDESWPEKSAAVDVAETIDPEPETKKISVEKSQDIFPFFMTAEEYLSARGERSAKALIATYELSRENLKTGDAVNTVSLMVQLGPDYAAMTTGSSVRIYDFRTEREINIRRGDIPVFDSRSLYAGAIRDINLINKNTDRGKTDSIALSDSVSLDAFWLETSLGWTARDISKSIALNQNKDELTAEYKGQNVLAMTFGGPKIDNPDILSSLMAFWHHDGVAHPAILADMQPARNLPDMITALSFSPTSPTGLKTTWTLKESKFAEVDFPLAANIPNIVETPKSAPLAFVIDQAARGDALGGEPSLNTLRDRVSSAAKIKDWFSAWVDATALARRQGGCENDPAILCDDIETLKTLSGESEKLELVLQAQSARTSDERLASLQALLPSIKDKTAPAAMLKAAGILRSKLKTEISEDLIKISAATLLESALIKDPYDPETYHVLSQVYAAQGRYAESWDLLDSLRQMENVPPSYISPVESVEKSLKRRAPGYFVPG